MGEIHSFVDDVFGPGGRLARMEGCDHRPQQHAMASLVASSLEEGSHRIIEAPTGVGKSLAYLVPGALLALGRGGRTVVSTHTRNLQDQLLARDIPTARALVGRPLAAAVLKGRRNYLCTTRLAHAAASAQTLFGKGDTDELEALRAWSRSAVDGDREHLPFVPSAAVWNAVCSERDLCGPPLCTGGCSYQRARERARSAQLLVINHALLLTLLSREGGAALPEGTAALILDEAHMLEAAATSVLGQSLSEGTLTTAIHRLYHPGTRRGLLARKRGIRGACHAAEAGVHAFFAAAARAMPRGSQTVPLHTAAVRPGSIPEELAHLAGTAAAAARESDDEHHARELDHAAGAILGAGALLAGFTDESDPSRAVWLETDPSSPAAPVFRSAPVDAAPLIGPLLFRDDTPAILTSATLAVGGHFDAFTARTGAAGVRCDQLDSPFDLAHAMTIVLARGIPEPDSAAYRTELPRWIRRCVRRSHGRALVLFTNAALMRDTARAARDDIERDGCTLLVQGEGVARAELLEYFREDVSSVLFGLESFWMGVDVPGPSLEHVVITRLPFAVPDHPLTAARMQRIVEQGGNAFAAYVLPEAILRMRQGAGRLIRTADDRGLVTILDARMLTRSYGPAVLASLPRCPVEVMDESGETAPLPREEW